MLIDDFFTLKIETMLPFSKSDHSILQGTLAQPWSQFAALPLASPMACVHNSIIEGIFKITLLLVKIISFYIFIWISWILFLCMAPFFCFKERQYHSWLSFVFDISHVSYFRLISTRSPIAVMTIHHPASREDRHNALDAACVTPMIWPWYEK